jgi:hypothetical protein
MLKDKAFEFTWFIPHERVLGEIEPFVANVENVKIPGRGGKKIRLAPHARVIYLSPRLEHTAWDIILAVVAHELAHIVLDHDLISQPGKYEAQENEAFEGICKWGFEAEAKKHRALQKRLDTMESREIERLKQEASSKMKH